MPAVAVVASLALSSVGITAASVGTAILGGATAVSAISGGTIIASALGGAVIGAGTGALSAAVMGGDIGKGALMGAVSGGIGSGVTSGLSQALSPGMSSIDLTGANYAPPEIGGSQALGAGVAKGVGSFAGGRAQNCQCDPQYRFWSTHHCRGHAYFPGVQSHRDSPRQKCTGGGAKA